MNPTNQQLFSLLLFLMSLSGRVATAQVPFSDPHDQFGKLFEEVQTTAVFADQKTFADCLPKAPPTTILAAYEKARQTRNFSLKGFVEQYFALPATLPTAPTPRPDQSPQQRIVALWPVLTRQPAENSRVPGGSLVALPKPYVATDSRTMELTYWSSYFTMLGLQASGPDQIPLIRNVVDNFAYLIHTVGFVPVGNRTYYLSRSQPPVFALMVSLLSELQGRRILLNYLPHLQQEYNFWMDGRATLTPQHPAYRRVVRLADGVYLNRYYDDRDTPRPEAYRDDILLAKRLKSNELPLFYRHLRAGLESGWAFSSRWLKDGKTLRTIHTTDLIPVDLNCLLLHLERTLAEGYRLKGDQRRTRMYQLLAQQRHDAIQRYCWSDRRNFYFDYDFVAQKPTTVYSAAAAMPLFVKIATPEQAWFVGQTLQRDFLKSGGLLATTSVRTDQLWDAPNGHAPVQWFAIQGLRQYNLTELANQIKRNWITENGRLYQATGKFLEAYNVAGSALSTNNGRPLPDGYGPTNGVMLRLLQEK